MKILFCFPDKENSWRAILHFHQSLLLSKAPHITQLYRWNGRFRPSTTRLQDHIRTYHSFHGMEHPPISTILPITFLLGSLPYQYSKYDQEDYGVYDITIGSDEWVRMNLYINWRWNIRSRIMNDWNADFIFPFSNEGTFSVIAGIFPFISIKKTNSLCQTITGIRPSFITDSMAFD